MYSPTTRVLTVLELLQIHPDITGAEIARRLEVDPRTVRKYITMLQDMGIPIEGERGRGGGYRLCAGFKLPPLMFTNDEALVLMLSLRAAQQTGLTGTAAAVEGSIAKVERVLPEVLRIQLQDLQKVLNIQLNMPPGIPTGSEVITRLGLAAQQQRQVRFQHESRSGEVTERDVNPYGLVYRVGRWYLVGYCHLRSEIRTFRLDRVNAVEILNEHFERPENLDIITHVEQALAATPGLYRVEVAFDTDLASVQVQVPAALGELTACEDGTTRLTCYVQRLPWFAGFLAGLTLPLRIISPQALHSEMRNLAQRVQNINDSGYNEAQQG